MSYTKTPSQISKSKDYKPWAKKTTKTESTPVDPKKTYNPKSSYKDFAKTRNTEDSKNYKKVPYESFKNKKYIERSAKKNQDLDSSNLGTESENSTNENPTSWGKVATWYDKMINDENSYQNKVILPKIMNILESNTTKNNSETILDLGCGVGFFTEKYYNRLVDTKADESVQNKIIGVEIGEESIQVAKTKTNSNISYHVNTAESLPFIKNMSVDNITIILAIQNIKFAQKCISECGRVLKKNGKCIVVLNHPYFRIPKNTSWNWDSENFVQFRRVDRYLSPFEIEIDMNPGKKNKTPKEKKEAMTISYHRPLSWYVNEFAKQGLFVENIQEWISHIEADQGPKKTPSLEFARQEFPVFMCLVLSKK